MEVDEITEVIVDAAVQLHMRLGPGLLESVYQVILAAELERRGLKVEREKIVKFSFDGLTFNEGLKLDLLINGQVIIELKSVEKLAPIHARQLTTYLRLMDLRVGLLINFGGLTLKEGLQRVVNAYQSPLRDSVASPRLRVTPNWRHAE